MMGTYPQQFAAVLLLSYTIFTRIQYRSIGMLRCHLRHPDHTACCTQCRRSLVSIGLDAHSLVTSSTRESRGKNIRSTYTTVASSKFTNATADIQSTSLVSTLSLHSALHEAPDCIKTCSISQVPLQACCAVSCRCATCKHPHPPTAHCDWSHREKVATPPAPSSSDGQLHTYLIPHTDKSIPRSILADTTWERFTVPSLVPVRSSLNAQRLRSKRRRSNHEVAQRSESCTTDGESLPHYITSIPPLNELTFLCSLLAQIRQCSNWSRWQAKNEPKRIN